VSCATTHLVDVELFERDVDLADELRVEPDSIADGNSAARADVGVVVLDKGQELRDEGVGHVEAVVFPDAVGEPGVLRVLVVDGDPDFARVVEVGQIERLEGLERGVADDDLLRECTLEERLNLVERRVELDGLAEVDEGRGGRLAQQRLRADQQDEVGDRRQARERRVADCKRAETEASASRRRKARRRGRPPTHTLRSGSP
jgi:hypothetical protein